MIVPDWLSYIFLGSLSVFLLSMTACIITVIIKVWSDKDA